MIPYGRQSIDDGDIASVLAVLKSDWLTQGPAVPKFELAMAKHCNVPHAVASNSATSALHLACLALGVTRGDLVWTSPNSFVASANCALYCGADVDFVDIDIHSGNMSVESLEEKLRAAAKNNSLPKVVIPVHFAGQSCQMERIAALAREYGFAIIEDASHAVGGKYQNQPVGSCQYADICIFSFHPVKIVTTGEGGMALTRSETLASTMRQLRSHGVTNRAEHLINESHGPWYYEQQTLGFNYRMNDIEAALGLSQLHKLNQFVMARNQLAEHYLSLLKNVPGISALQQHPDCYNSYHLFVVRMLQSDQSLQRHVVAALRAEGIFAQIHYIPIYLQPFYQQRGFTPGYCPNAERYYSQTLSLPLFPELTSDQQNFVFDRLTTAIKHC
ncbi:MAG: UDP-4-amino-4,6-dideoxy-N-acetyl-beta-L-altrosamine transaminase [Pseudomonadota bacterium]|nr:UDP-4-amino-4,6-dideoxy-N-acetyl-beta-L-altrosamine transaminase [Pseudomonadota bacterium]